MNRLPTHARPRIAIPMPHSIDREYGERAIPQYERAIEQAGGEPVRISLDQPSAEVMKLEVLKIMERSDGVLLPGSNADVDPAKFGATRSPRSADADPRRDTVDELLLQDAYNLRKPVLGICYGLQTLNVYRNGSLIQHIPDFLPEETRAKVNHAAGKDVAVAHAVVIEQGSKLEEILCRDSRSRLSDRAQPDTAPADSIPGERKRIIPVNSSHHQSAEKIGDGLRVVAHCTSDGIIEALEGTSPD